MAQPEEHQFPLCPVPDEIPFDRHAVYVPVPIDKLQGRRAITAAELAGHALSNIPGEFPEYIQRVAAGLDRLEGQPDEKLPQLLQQGPVEGIYYVRLPGPDERA